MSTPKTSHLQPPRKRNRPSLSCTQCRERKQKCNRAKDRLCNNCVRRWSPVECIYEKDLTSSRSGSKSRATQDDEEPYFEPNDFEDEGAGTFEDFDLDFEMTELDLQTPTFMDTGSASFTPDLLDAFQGGTSNYNAEMDANFFSFDQASIANPDFDFETHIDQFEFGMSPNSMLGSQHNPDRNAELLHFFSTTMLPLFPPNIQDYLSQQIHTSSLIQNLAILAFAYYLAEDAETNVDVISSRSVLIEKINSRLVSQEHEGASDEIILAILALSFLEFIYSNTQTVINDMNWSNDILTTRGGLESIYPTNVMLRTLLMITDYQISLTYSLPLFFHPSTPTPTPTQNPSNLPAHLCTPLLQSTTSFSDIETRQLLGLSEESAKLLNDMRFLSTSILLTPNLVNNRREMKKFHKTARWISSRLTPLADTLSTNNFNDDAGDDGSGGDKLNQILNTTAHIFLRAILERKPLSHSTLITPSIFTELVQNIPQFSEERKREIAGVLMWILLVVSTACFEHGELQMLGEERRSVKVQLTQAILIFGDGLEDVQEGGGLERVLRGWREVVEWLSSQGGE